ncbi:hypothetical protein DUI87_11057 [Hirundo rustica rustica]|uniref:Uncharacterized protein n=1 Tax=Hirundo rustica rustica TaxID=333673 RepID=A0A3M0KLU0_HIRRU|nr:hypothetical protein DUI87_11057 [Hirundo rustica rustica]
MLSSDEWLLFNFGVHPLMYEIDLRSNKCLSSVNSTTEDAAKQAEELSQQLMTVSLEKRGIGKQFTLEDTDINYSNYSRGLDKTNQEYNLICSAEAKTDGKIGASDKANIWHGLIKSVFNQRIVFHYLYAHEVDFVPHLYLFVLIITIYLLKASNIICPGLSGKTLYYDKAKLIRTQNLRLAQLILHLCDEAGIAVVILAVQNAFLTQTLENVEEEVKKQMQNTSKHMSQKHTKSQARIEFSLNPYLTGPSCKLGQGECANCCNAFE